MTPKARGNTFERQVANFLSQIHGKDFRRTAHSGAYTGLSNAGRKKDMAEDTIKAFLGDIIPPEGFNIVIECKNYSGIQGGFNGIMSGLCTGLDKWLKEVLFDSENKKPHILAFKITRYGTYICFPEKIFSDIVSELTKQNISYTKYYLEYTDKKKETLAYVIIDQYFYKDVAKYVETIIKEK